MWRHGRLCTTHPWQVIFSVITLTVTILSVSDGYKDEKPPATSQEYQGVDVVLMTVVRCGALLCTYHQFRTLHRIGSKYILGANQESWRKCCTICQDSCCYTFGQRTVSDGSAGGRAPPRQESSHSPQLCQSRRLSSCSRSSLCHSHHAPPDHPRHATHANHHSHISIAYDDHVYTYLEGDHHVQHRRTIHHRHTSSHCPSQ
ncbi:uncharacterized protein LOC143022837 [Oratosquilla oratoria]|uniref:uncharacterized protein LOC143022837 n=1 Tax=Oratosquilla oratoria TaxID=337810 RepID=UPI003F767900